MKENKKLQYSKEHFRNKYLIWIASSQLFQMNFSNNVPKTKGKLIFLLKQLIMKKIRFLSNCINMFSFLV